MFSYNYLESFLLSDMVKDFWANSRNWKFPNKIHIFTSLLSLKISVKCHMSEKLRKITHSYFFNQNTCWSAFYSTRICSRCSNIQTSISFIGCFKTFKQKLQWLNCRLLYKSTEKTYKVYFLTVINAMEHVPNVENFNWTRYVQVLTIF